MKKKNNSLVIILMGIIIVILAVLCYLFATNTIYLSNNDNKKINKANDSIINSDTGDNNKTITEDKTVLDVYESGDKNATNGNPETLEIYNMNDDEIEFKYHAIWNQSDVLGKASKESENTYIYENEKYKIKFIFNKLENDSVEITEYSNDQLSSQVNLFKQKN